MALVGLMHKTLRFLILAWTLVGGGTAFAQEQPVENAQVIWRLLDYVAVDYSSAVSAGAVVNDAEFREMVEFAAEVGARLDELPRNSFSPGLTEQARALQRLIADKADAKIVAASAHGLADAVLEAFPSPVAPVAPPDLQRGASLYSEKCAGCHGVTGLADGPDAKDLDPQPIAFAEVDRARERSILGLYQVIGQGLEGTAMESFSDLPEADRWALAFYVGSFAFSDGAALQGEQLWKSDPELRATINNLAALTQKTPATVAQTIGETNARAVTAYLRRNPGAITDKPEGGLTLARLRLRQSGEAYRSGDHSRARDLALSAYLDGFEPSEPSLAVRDPGLLRDVEAAMADLRAAISSDASSADVDARIAQIVALFDRVEEVLDPTEADSGAGFLGAFTILLREGLEALLIVVTMLAFLRKAERVDMTRYVHIGWISALLAGAATWAVATNLIQISGASRELTEGFGSLLAAVVLIGVGIWMHGKGQADAWQTYIKERLSQALSKKSAWFLFAMAFVVVYREVFETILFFTALWSQGEGVAMLAGSAAAVVVLGFIAWIMLRYSRRLPIGKFFSWSAILMAALAVVLTGKGIAGLQEAGLLDVRPLDAAPRIDILGLYPTWEGVVAQSLVLLVLAVGFWRASRPAVPDSH